MPVKKLKEKHGLKKTELTKTIQVSLPETKSKPHVSLQDFIILLYGEKKIGKTTLTAQFDKTLHLMFEPGGKALAIYQRNINSWSEFKQYVKLLISDKQYHTVTIDTVDIAYNMCLDYICEKHVIDHPQDEGYGKGWKWVRDEFTKEIFKLAKSGKGLILISHSKEEEVEKRSGGKYHKIAPTASGQARDILEGMVDIWCYYGYDEEDRYLWIQGNDHIGAGHRIEGHFLSRKGNAIKRIHMGNSSKEAYENFINAFYNDIKLSSSKK